MNFWQCHRSMTGLIRVCLLAAVAFVNHSVLMSSSAQADGKVAVFGFELIEGNQRTGQIAPPGTSKDVVQRLHKMADSLGDLLNKKAGLEVVDVSGLAPEIEKARPFYDCDGCEVGLAKSVGADYSATGAVKKVSAALINVTIVLRDVATNTPKRAGSVIIRENTDQGWLRAVRQLVRNQILSEPL